MADNRQTAALLAGYRVLDLTSSMGALCGKLLRDLGMDVIKVEAPGGDPTRGEPPFAEGHVHREGSLRFAYLNAGKRSITLDLASALGRELLLDLIARADIVVEDSAPGALAEFGLGYDTLLARQNKLILVSVSGFGQDGTYARFQTTDLIGNAMGGLLYISGDPLMTPCNPPDTLYVSLSNFPPACSTVMASSTPGIFSALLTSMRRMRARGCGFDSSRIHTMFGRLMRVANSALPVKRGRATSGIGGIGLPMMLRFCGG